MRKLRFEELEQRQLLNGSFLPPHFSPPQLPVVITYISVINERLPLGGYDGQAISLGRSWLAEAEREIGRVFAAAYPGFADRSLEVHFLRAPGRPNTYDPTTQQASDAVLALIVADHPGANANATPGSPAARFNAVAISSASPGSATS